VERLGWTGPYEISQKLSNITYEIWDCKTSKSKIVHVHHLKQFTSEEFEEQNVPDEPSITHEEPDNESDDNVPSYENETSHIYESKTYTRSGRLIKPPSRYL
jgi:hypothetical protein